MSMKKISIIFCLQLVFVIAFSTACLGKKGDSWLKHIFSPSEDVEEEGPIAPQAQLTAKAMHYFDIGRYQLAEEEFKKIRDRYPFSPYATVAELRLADCKFYQSLYEEAIPLYEEFEDLHPTNEAIPYVIFQIGSCYYNLMDTPDRDQTSTHKMIDTYYRLIKRYPDCAFRLEAEKRITEGRELLAEHEWVVAHWYLRTDHVPQALKRLENIVTIYPDTPIYHKAAKILAEHRDELAKLDQMEQESSEPVTLKEEKHWWNKIWPF